jgi:hypothetical protein
VHDDEHERSRHHQGRRRRPPASEEDCRRAESERKCERAHVGIGADADPTVTMRPTRRGDDGIREEERAAARASNLAPSRTGRFLPQEYAIHFPRADSAGVRRRRRSEAKKTQPVIEDQARGVAAFARPRPSSLRSVAGR